MLGRDFSTDSDLLLACIILQKQQEHLNKNQDNIIIPRAIMNNNHSREQIGMNCH